MDTIWPPGKNLTPICVYGTIPGQSTFERIKLLAPVLSATRLTTIADWLITEFPRETEAELRDGVSQRLVNLMVESGEVVAMQELRRVQALMDGAKQVILNAAILELEDRLIGRTPPKPSEGSLLDFINLPLFAMVRDERDLFEVVCQAIEDIQSELENAASEGVAVVLERITTEDRTGLPERPLASAA